jgi:hypothetical protein
MFVSSPDNDSAVVIQDERYPQRMHFDSSISRHNLQQQNQQATFQPIMSILAATSGHDQLLHNAGTEISSNPTAETPQRASA